MKAKDIFYWITTVLLILYIFRVSTCSVTKPKDCDDCKEKVSCAIDSVLLNSPEKTAIITPPIIVYQRDTINIKDEQYILRLQSQFEVDVAMYQTLINDITQNNKKIISAKKDSIQDLVIELKSNRYDFQENTDLYDAKCSVWTKGILEKYTFDIDPKLIIHTPQQKADKRNNIITGAYLYDRSNGHGIGLNYLRRKGVFVYGGGFDGYKNGLTGRASIGVNF